MRHSVMPSIRSSFDYPWVADTGDGTYRNPVLCADYPDPDVIRDGSDFYLVVSSFHCTPGLPIVHSRDLVNWTLINHAVENLPSPRFDSVLPGCGIWAPSIRKHAGRFWIFFGMPDEGIYCVTAPHPAERWSEPQLVCAGKGLIDPCPLWDADGSAYLVHAFAFSRSGLKNRLRISPMAPDGSRLLGEGKVVFEDPQNHPTIEGPKFLQRNGYYFILAPAGGVENGWQTALRSRNIFGPYESRKVLEQGSTFINGPHQGALVDTGEGDWWFVHFQDAQPYGRVLHLQPARWENDWPVIGVDADENGIGEPVLRHRMPLIARDDRHKILSPQSGDEFDRVSERLGPQWHWNANHSRDWFSLSARPGWLRLFGQPSPQFDRLDLVHFPGILLQKFPARSFAVDARVDFRPSGGGQCAGLAVVGRQCAALVLRRSESRLVLECNIEGVVAAAAAVPLAPIVLQIRVSNGGGCTFGYQLESGQTGTFPAHFRAVGGTWVGAKIGLFVQAESGGGESGGGESGGGESGGGESGGGKNGGVIREGGYADFDYLRFGANGGEAEVHPEVSVFAQAKKESHAP